MSTVIHHICDIEGCHFKAKHVSEYLPVKDLNFGIVDGESIDICEEHYKEVYDRGILIEVHAPDEDGERIHTIPKIKPAEHSIEKYNELKALCEESLRRERVLRRYDEGLGLQIKPNFAERLTEALKDA